jgi:RPA family protein
MSQNPGQGQTPMREVAQRVFAHEFNDATYTFREADDDRAPIYALLPTGAKANRVFVVGTLTETEDVGSEDEYWQGRIVDPTGTVFVYAGQYQPEAAGMLREADPPAFVAVVGKPRTYETDDGDINVSLRPEHLTIVDESTRHRWVVETAERTLERIETFEDATNEYAQMARTQYGNAIEPYRTALIEALESLDQTDPGATSAPSDESDELTIDTDPNASTRVSDEDGDGDRDTDPDSDMEPSPTATVTEPAAGDDDEASGRETDDNQSEFDTLDDIDETEDFDPEDNGR